jgi:hypothetical protein
VCWVHGVASEHPKAVNTIVASHGIGGHGNFSVGQETLVYKSRWFRLEPDNLAQEQALRIFARSVLLGKLAEYHLDTSPETFHFFLDSSSHAGACKADRIPDVHRFPDFPR